MIATQVESLDSAWQTHFRAWLTFRDKHGQDRVPPEQKALAEWCQRLRIHPEGLSRTQIELLLDHKFLFRPLDQRWFQLWRTYTVFVQTYGHACVPNKGAWLT